MVYPASKAVQILIVCLLIGCTLAVLFFSNPRQHRTTGVLLQDNPSSYRNRARDKDKNGNKDMSIDRDVTKDTQSNAIISKEDEQELTNMVEKSHAASTNLNDVEKKCAMYQEFRRMNFLHPVMRNQLCSNAEAFKKYSDGYPVCKLRNSINEEMLNVVRRGSDVVGILDLQNIRIPMFVYKGSDHVSNTIRNSGGWEPELVQWILKFALKLPDVTFLDMGCNIGVYSLQAAKLGLPVVSLDANIRNLLRLRLSLNAAKRDATLLWNFVASDQTLKYLSFLADCNVGGAGRDKANLPDTVPVMPIRSERVCEFIKTKTVVMKMDIQGAEAEFLSMSGRLFSDFNIAAVQIEWYPPMIRGNESQTIVKFFVSRGYQAWRVPGFHGLNMAEVAKWGSIDIIWVHKKYLSMM